MTASLNRSRPPWWRVLLPASIVLNLFLVAVIGSHVWQVHRSERAGELPLARALQRAEAILPPKDAARFGAVMRHDAPQFVEAARHLDAARERLRNAITADHFNKAEVSQAFAAWQAAYNNFLDDIADPLTEALSQVSPEGRRKLVAAREAARAPAAQP
jgi:uncharacterized membrane protein